ncbi:MAG: aldo/keto reductase [Pseudomonadota bacterium]|nr:aldo/keto reductase [Pseudomonadota bacterium]
MRLGLGTMRYCGAGAWGEPPDPQAVQNTIQAAYAQGVRLFDSAGFYGPDIALRLLRSNLPQDHDAVISTKVGLRRYDRRDWVVDASPHSIQLQVEADLRTLSVDCLDLVFLRLGDGKSLRRDPVPLEVSMSALLTLQQAGKIREVGLSQCTLSDVQVAQAVMPIQVVQNQYSLNNQSDIDVLAFCESTKIDYWAYAPFGMGRGLMSPRATLSTLAMQYQCSVAQLCLAWLLAKSPVLYPIFGTTNPQHLQDNVHSISVQLSAVDRAYLSQFWDV